MTYLPSHANLLNDFWEMLLQSKWAATKAAMAKVQRATNRSTKKKKLGGGRKKIHEKFPSIVDHLNSFIEQHSTTAHERRREETEELDTTPDYGLGFRMVDLLHYLYEKVDGLYEHGFDQRSCARLLAPPHKGRATSAKYHSVVNIKIGRRRNDKRSITQGVHFARAERRISYEFFVRHRQPNMSGDDMNIIQVGRPAVSRYHQIIGFYPW